MGTVHGTVQEGRGLSRERQGALENMKLGIIGAMEVEVELLKEALAGEVSEHAGMEFARGSLGKTPCVAVRCGVGKVNAALCTQVLADVFGVTHVVNTGVAGSLDESLHVGDIVVASDAVYHDLDVTNLGYEPGQVPGMQLAFPADASLSEAALAAAREVAPQARVVTGRVASGDQFVYEAARKQEVRRLFGATCCEMEGCAIAHACTANGLPFAILRAISDNADGSDVEAYPVFEEKAARACAAIVERLAVQLGDGDL